MILFLSVIVLSVVNALPLAFVSMLFFGNVGWNVGFMEILPAAMAIYFVKYDLVNYLAKKGTK